MAAALVAWCTGTARSEPSPEVRARNQRQQAAEMAQPATGSTTIAPAAESPVIASFVGGRITIADMEAAAANKDPSTRARIAAPGGREAFLEELVRFDLLVLEAERRGYGYHPEVVEAGKHAAIEQMVVRDLSVEPTAISLDDVKRHFEANRAKYERPLMRRASLIQVATEPEARALIAELKGATRERFAKVAGERSHDERTRRQGGELGYFDRKGRLGAAGAEGAVPPELVEAAFALRREGAISARPIAVGEGFGVLMLTGETPALPQEFAGVEDALRAQLAELRTAEAQEALLVQLRERWQPEVHPERIDAIQLEPARRLDQPQGFPAAPPDPRAASQVVEPDGI
jgi:parvulin-like peptidyl-prolyl isomerase